MVKVRINFGVSEFIRDWIITQPNIIRVSEQSVNHITFEHNMTGPQLVAFRNGFIQMLVEDVI